MVTFHQSPAVHRRWTESPSDTPQLAAWVRAFRAWRFHFSDLHQWNSLAHKRSMQKTLLPKQAYPLLVSLGALLVILVVVRRIEDGGNAELEALYIMGIPDVPNLTGWPPELNESLKEAYEGMSDQKTRFHSLAKLGKLYHANGFVTQAASCYKALVKLQPNNALWPYLTAALYEDYADQALPIEQLLRVRTLNAEYSPASLRLARSYLKIGDLDSAEEEFISYLKLEKGDYFGLKGLADVAAAKGDLERAKSLLDQLVESGQATAEVYWKRAELFEASGSLEESLLNLARADNASSGAKYIDPWVLSIGEYSFESHRLRQYGRAALSLEQHAKAKRFAKRAIALEPDTVHAYLLLADVLLAMNAINQAIAVLKEATEEVPDADEPYLKLARLKWEDGDLDAAMAIARDGLQSALYETNLLLELGRMHRESGEGREAIALMKEARSKNPDHLDAAKELALLELEHHMPEAEKDLRHYLQLAPYDDGTWVTLGKLQLSKRKMDLALYSFEKALAANENNRGARRLIAMTYRRLGSEAAHNGRSKDAIELFELAIAHDPKDAKSYLNLGAVHEAMGDNEAAIAQYSKYVDLKPRDCDGFLKLGRLLVSNGQRETARSALMDGRQMALTAEKHSVVLQFDALLDVVE